MDERRPLLLNNETDYVSTTKDNVKLVPKDTAEGCRRCAIPCRYTLVFMIFWGYVTSFTQRTGFNIALVAMVNFTADSNHGNMSHDCPVPANTSNIATQSSTEGSFDWDADLQGLLLGAFYYGYPLSQLPGGYLADRYGGKYVFIFMGVGTGVLSLLIPTAAHWSPYALIAVRALQGICQGPLFPSCLAMLSRWVPPSERTSMLAIAIIGASVGIVMATGASGFVCDSAFLGGWPSIFYISGGLGIVWTLCWIPLIYNTPSEHPRISVEECTYIEKETQGLGKTKSLSTPWCAMITSGPVWGILLVKFLDAFSYYTVFNCVPIYMKQVLHFNIAEDGVLSALPYITQIPMGFFVGWLADFIRRKGFIRVVNIRRAFCIIGEFVPAVLLLLVGYVGCNADVVVALLIMNKAIGSFLVAGPNPSMFDIAPLYAGTLMGLLNGITNTGGFIAPQVVAALTGNSVIRVFITRGQLTPTTLTFTSSVVIAEQAAQGDQRLWQDVFYIGAAVSTLGTLVYCVLITDKEQPWAKPDTQEKQGEVPKL